MFLQMNTMTDPHALSAHRARARPESMFIHEAVADEIEDRLNLVNRTFTNPAVVTGFTSFWSERLPETVVVPDADTLDLASQSHDLVLHLMGLHWANDPVGQLIQCRHALRPDGLMIVASLGGETLHELRRCLGEAEIRHTGGLSPRVAPMAELRDIGALMQRSGLALPVADLVPLNASYKDGWHLMRDLRNMGEANALQARQKSFTRPAIIKDAMKYYTENFSAPDGRVAATFELVFLTGWAPDAAQPQPLRPGSAQKRLADVLNTSETKLPD